MTHPERKLAKGIDMPGRCHTFTDIVYSGEGNSSEKLNAMHEAENSFLPGPPAYQPFIGEMHGHTNFSDGGPDIDTYFRNLRDTVKLDFGAITDHDHGGVGKPELWVGNPSKWDIIRQKVKEYTVPGEFTAILAYERDSYPYYNNMILYYGTTDGEMVRGVRDGEITGEELKALLARDDIVVSPHDTYLLSSGADFNTIPLDLMTPFIEIYSRCDAAEYMGNPAFQEGNYCEGGFWQDALRRGAKMGCIAGSDDHGGTNGRIMEEWTYPGKFPGLTGIWAKENTLPSLFKALKARRCYAYMGGKMTIDFRINGHYMGEEFSIGKDDDLSVYFNITADAKIKQVTVVKNCRDYVRFFGYPSSFFFDYRREQPTDYYYLRVELEDGRFGWTSPIWVSCKE